MRSQPVIAVFDVGKTNKKLFLFDQNYKIVYERSARFLETVDEDGFPCENIESLRLSVFDSLRQVFNKKTFCIKALNFSAYGASLVYIDEEGAPVAPLYNYLKPYPPALQNQLHEKYGGEERFSLQTASPVLGSLNSGLQLYRLKHEKPGVFEKARFALHLPQYLAFLVSGKACSDITSIGCHTALWDFEKNNYHEWVKAEGIDEKLAPIASYDKVYKATFPGNNYLVGTGLHDSSAALIPYMVSFQEPFVLLSTGTWCISMNPFNDTALTVEELKQDCLSYLHYKGRPVKASRFFAGMEHEEGVKRIAEHFNQDLIRYRNLRFDATIIDLLQKKQDHLTSDEFPFRQRSLQHYDSYEEAYHRLMMDIVSQQVQSTNLVLKGSPVKRLFVDGGFSNNHIFMNLMAAAFPQLEIYAASMAQATSLGAALAIHSSWNKEPVPASLIQLQFYSPSSPVVV